MDAANICFMHAPLFHPAMKNVAPIRKELGVKTFFNMLGPMVNPAFPTHQLIGVFSLELARQYGYLYQQTDKNYVIVHALDGYDELSLTGPAKYYYNGGEQIIDAEDMNLPSCSEDDLLGGASVEESAAIFKDVLEGRGTAQQNAAVVANAGMALYCANQERGLGEAISRASDALTSGEALLTFKKFLDS
jgi:anthranilate phosphoribosyltransferase